MRRWWYIDQYYVHYYVLQLQMFPSIFDFGMYYIWAVIGVIRRTAGSPPLSNQHALLFILPAIVFHAIMIPLSLPGHVSYPADIIIHDFIKTVYLLID
jgi:hypothetical protein